MTFAFFLMAGGAIAEPRIVDLRVGEHPGFTRLVIEVSDGLEVRIPEKTSPDRMRVVLGDVAWAADVAARADAGIGGHGLISRLARRREPAEAGWQLRLALTRPVAVSRRFALAPMEGFQHRVVIDFMEVPAAVAVPARQKRPRASQDTAPAREAEPEAAPGKTAEAAEQKRPKEFTPLAGAPPPIATDGLRQRWNGNITGEVRLFPRNVAGLAEADVSVAIEPRYEAAWNNGMQAVTAVAFARLDAEDDERSHVDLRELKWTGVFGDWEIRIGVDRVFWGVTESVHLVDVINQIDGVEDIDEEDHLGQPMAAVSWTRPWGTLTAYVLPYFRQRTFPGAGERLSRLPVRKDLAMFQSGDKHWHADWALRYSHAIGAFDIGIAHFSGTARDPLLRPRRVDGTPVLVPFYRLIDQTSLDLQGTFGALLLKFEGLTVRSQGDRYNAFAGGFEYTLFGMGDGRSDLGLLAEYLYDDRGETGPSAFQDDLFLGLRWAANNSAGSTILAGAIMDMTSSAVAASIEASQRLGQRWKLSFDARLFFDVPADDPLYQLSRDDFVQIRLGRHF